MVDKFPLHYRPRPYQAEAHTMFRKYMISGVVFPRQAGKDVCMVMENMEARLRNPVTNGVYVSIDKPSVRNIIWDKSYYDPVLQRHIKMLEDNVPSHLVKWKSAFMEGHFTNKSIMKLDGYFQSGKDQNGVGTAFDDYSFTELSLFGREDPIPRLQPIITSGNGVKRLMFAATPRGKRNNPLWQIIQTNANNPNFSYLLRTIDDLNEMMRRHGLPPVRSQESLEMDRESYLIRFGNDRMFNQEYHVSFEEMDAATLYGEALMRIMATRRSDPVYVNPAYPVYVGMDIGSAGVHSDATAWIAFQWYNEKLFLVDCGEGHMISLPEYVDEFAKKSWFPKLAQIILPWDASNHTAAIRETPADMMRKRFSNVAVLAKGSNIWTTTGLPNTESADIITMVQQVRMQLENTYINGLTDDEKEKNVTRYNCDRVLECMENYKYAYNAKTQEWSPFPVHDKYSHMMDALRYVVQATKELDFFGGNLYGSAGADSSMDYVEEYNWGY